MHVCWCVFVIAHILVYLNMSNISACPYFFQRKSVYIVLPYPFTEIEYIVTRKDYHKPNKYRFLLIYLKFKDKKMSECSYIVTLIIDVTKTVNNVVTWDHNWSLWRLCLISKSLFHKNIFCATNALLDVHRSKLNKCSNFCR